MGSSALGLIGRARVANVRLSVRNRHEHNGRNKTSLLFLSHVRHALLDSFILSCFSSFLLTFSSALFPDAHLPSLCLHLPIPHHSHPTRHQPLAFYPEPRHTTMATTITPATHVVTYVRRPGLGTSGRAIRIRSNFFEVTQLSDNMIHHYDVTITPEVPPPVNRKIFHQFTTSYGTSHLKGARAVYDGRNNIFSARAFAFESHTFEVKTQEVFSFCVCSMIVCVLLIRFGLFASGGWIGA